MAAFVTFEDVSKVYHSGEIEIRAVDHISFTIEKGEFLSSKILHDMIYLVFKK